MSEIGLAQYDYELTPAGYEPISGEPQELHGLRAPTIDYHELIERFKQGNETYDVVKGPSGKKYETIVFNPEKISTANILKPSTSYSSAYKNPANVLETALAATANPGSAYTYIGSIGNHPTRNWKLKEALYIARTGRLTYGNGSSEMPYRALGSVEDLAEMLSDRGLEPDYLTADAEAGRLALSLATALPKDSVKGVLLNGIDGISHSANYEAAKLSEDLKSRIYRRRNKDIKIGDLTPVNIKDVKKKMPRIYHGLGQIAHIAPLPVFLFPHDDFDKGLTTLGFRSNDELDEIDNHAVFHDISAALRKQEATFTMLFNNMSDIHDLEKCKRFGSIVMKQGIPPDIRSHARRARILFGEGTLDQHTDKPHDRTRIERHVFSDIRHHMQALSGGLLQDSEIFKLQPIRKVA